MFAVLNINKPAGLTSRDVVDRVKRLVRPHKVGHAGTLDPIATGVLLVCVGQATRLVEYAQRLPKSYHGTFLLGRRSETDDVERDVEIVSGARTPTLAEVEAALPRFVGSIAQRPPRHSAVKIAGQRAYQLARRGVAFEPAAKTVEIHRLEIVRYDYPELQLAVECGSGTYIRSLGRDLAESLGTSAVMSALDRTAIGCFSTTTALRHEQLIDEWQLHLQSPALLVAGLSSLTVTPAELRELQHGRPIQADPQRYSKQTSPTEEIAALDASGNLVALLDQRRPGQLMATRNFTQPEGPSPSPAES
jgi:tRNA pseudouridine55 synthase